MILQYAVEKFDCRIHGFCCMTNHIHLVIQTGEISLSRIMQNISIRYTKWINFTRSRTGHLFQGRYKALLLDADEYLLELIRYVHLNPVRAGIVAVPEEHPWSGHHAYLGTITLPWLTTDWVLSQFSGNIKKARAGYRSFVSDGLNETRKVASSVMIHLPNRYLRKRLSNGVEDTLCPSYLPWYAELTASPKSNTTALLVSNLSNRCAATIRIGEGLREIW